MGTTRTAAGGVNITPVDDDTFRYKETVRVEVAQKEGQDQWIRPEGGVVNQAGPFTLNIPRCTTATLTSTVRTSRRGSWPRTCPTRLSASTTAA